ncbi:MAG: hypothetical protein ACRCYS_15020 [Beijerinckiaceae bacterium]
MSLVPAIISGVAFGAHAQTLSAADAASEVLPVAGIASEQLPVPQDVSTKGIEKAVQPAAPAVVAQTARPGVETAPAGMVMNAPVFEGIDIPLPPRRPVASAQTSKPKKKVVAAAPMPAAPVIGDSYTRIAMARPAMPRVWMTVGSGF